MRREWKTSTLSGKEALKARLRDNEAEYYMTMRHIHSAGIAKPTVTTEINVCYWNGSCEQPVLQRLLTIVVHRAKPEITCTTSPS